MEQDTLNLHISDRENICAGTKKNLFLKSTELMTESFQKAWKLSLILKILQNSLYANGTLNQKIRFSIIHVIVCIQQELLLYLQDSPLWLKMYYTLYLYVANSCTCTSESGKFITC